MLDSSVLDVAIGLSFVFFLLSLLATTIGELISRVLALRSSTLYGAIRNLFAETDDRLFAEFWNHPLIKTLSVRNKKGISLGEGRDKPSYIPANLFVLAFLDAAYAQTGAKDGIKTSAEVRLALAALADPELRRLLLSVIGVESTTLEQDRKELAKWFDEYMERVSGWYKRKAQVIALVLGLTLAAILNVDTLTIANTLISNPVLRDSVTQIAKDYVQSSPETGSTGISATISVTDTRYLAEKVTQIASLQGKLASLNLPILWLQADEKTVDPREVPVDPTGWLYKILGLLVTGLLVSLGAPFWFDLLNRFVNLRASGPPPEKVTDKDTKSSGGEAPPPSDVTKPTGPPTPLPTPGDVSELQRLADDAVQYVEDLRNRGYVKLREDDVAIAHVITAVTDRQLNFNETEIRAAVRAALDRRRNG